MKLKKRFLLLIAVLGMMLFGMVGCSGVFDNSTTIDLNKYIKIETEGYSTMGSAEVYFDWDAFAEDYSDKIKVVVKEDNANDYEMNLELNFGTKPYVVLGRCCVDFTTDKVNDLSNGDVIKVTWNCDDANAKKYFNCKLKYSDIEHKVEGLKEVSTFDPFESLEVKFDGVAPNGKVSLEPNYDKQEMQYINFSIDKDKNLSNGDVIVVTARVDDNFIEKFNAVPSPTTKEFVVTGLTSYATSVAQMDESVLEQMKKQSEDVYMAHIAKNWSDSEELLSFTYVGNYFLSTKKELDAWYDYGKSNNYMYMVYKVDAKCREESYPHYTWIEFKDITIDENGKYKVNLSNSELTSNKWIAYDNGVFDRIYYMGYENLDDLYKQTVMERIDKYSYEKNIIE